MTVNTVSSGAGPSRPLQTSAIANNNTRTRMDSGVKDMNGNGEGSLWSEILGSMDRSKGLKRKNVIVLSERHHGRSHLLAQLASGSKKKRPTTRSNQPHDQHRQFRNGRKGLALGYEVLDIGDGDEDSVPPLSVFYPPSSHPSLLKLLPKALPPKSLSDTAVVIVLDWTKPSSMVQELVNWLSWVEEWASSAGERGEAEEMREKLQSHFQHYLEPPVAAAGSSGAISAGVGNGTTFAGVGPLLPLGQGTLTLNPAGIPIVVVCTKADLMDSVGDEIGLKGGGWEERTDWIQQALRTVCLAYGASLFYTASTQPETYLLLRTYLLHRLYTIPPPLNPVDNPNSSPQTEAIQHTSSIRFPFPYRANALDRDAIMVPSGWDSWGKINVLREGFDPARIGKALAASLSRKSSGEDGQVDEETLEDIWVGMIPDTERGPRPTNGTAISSTTEPEQTFLSRQLDLLMKDPNRDPRQSFRHAAATVVGPMSGSEGLSLPGVEKAMADMEELEKGEELKEKFARFGRKDSGRGTSGPLSPTGTAPSGTPTPSMPNEALHNFFQGLLANRSKTGSGSGSAAPSAATNSTPGGTTKAAGGS
ncbi:hypothetical protein I316_03459 [Kwoniella heveanensis BCC8398]|uniref:Dynein light intermediate chain 1, cytosolic n=1 Tax=Kwoniella heveanensis BCC8398 TaxID=1296120 RepID=A0A1B9GV86_9TREE|nr:hypothetical protein I316_03459 [Kwoniella heveanensis BCC8398]